MSWRTEVQSVQFKITDNLRNKFDTFRAYLDGKVGTAKAQFNTMVTGTSYIGINGQKIVYMRDAIRNYVKEIQDHLDKVVEDASTEKAFHGDYAKAVTEYVKMVEETCKSYTTALLEFSDNLDIIADAYHQKDETFASSIRNTAGEASSMASTYTEQRHDASYGTATRASYGN